MGEERKVYTVVVGKREGKIPLRRLRSRWEDGIRMNMRGGEVDLLDAEYGPVLCTHACTS
jgi:hypothetical protein